MTLLTDFAAIKDRAIKADIPPEKNNLSADELDIKEAAQQIANKEADSFDAFLQTKHEELNSIATKNTQLNQELDKTGLISPTMNQAEVLANVGSHVQKDLANRQPAIDARVKLMEADTIWKRFRAEHNLTHREADYPHDYYIHFAPILGIVILEALMCAYYYINENGLLGGAVTAVGIAISNLGVCGFLGFFFRYHNLVKPEWKRNLGWVTLPTFIFFMIWFNATLAAFRVLYQLQTNNPFIDAMIAAIQMMIFKRMPFADVTSFTLFIVGILFSFAAFYKGYTFKDAYPAYQEKDKKKKEHQSEYDKQISQVNPDKTIQKLVQELDDIIRQANSLHRISAIKEEILNKEETYKNLQTKTNEQLNAAISYFREHQLAIRATGMSAPSYFSNAVPTINFRVIPTDKLLQKIDDIHVKNQTLDARINQYVTPTLKMINANKPQIATEAKREFITQVDKSAQERIHPI